MFCSAGGKRVHFWPFDGWDVPAGHSAIAEAYPALWSRNFAIEDRTPDQHDAFSIAAWLSRADRNDRLAACLKARVGATCCYFRKKRSRIPDAGIECHERLGGLLTSLPGGLQGSLVRALNPFVLPRMRR